MIIGITGEYASGKDTIASYLEKKGFEHYSLSDELRKEAQRRKIKATLPSLSRLGDELREKFGPRILAERVHLRLREKRDYVISSLFTPDEIKVFEQDQVFILIAVIAEAKQRLARLTAMAHKDDHQDQAAEGLTKLSAKGKRAVADSYDACLKRAKIIIKNDGTIEELYAKIDRLVIDLNKRFHHRPSWDEYFMGITDAVAQRGTCDRGRTASIIVRDKRILATGYVGSPAGAGHCDEIGHQFKKVIHEDGHVSQHCVRTNHGELNAITLAARNGVFIDGATMYCRMTPCYTCAKMIVNAGIKRVVCQKRYHADQDSAVVFKQAGVKLEILDRNFEKYDGQ